MFRRAMSARFSGREAPIEDDEDSEEDEHEEVEGLPRIVTTSGSESIKTFQLDDMDSTDSPGSAVKSPSYRLRESTSMYVPREKRLTKDQRSVSLGAAEDSRNEEADKILDSLNLSLKDGVAPSSSGRSIKKGTSFTLTPTSTPGYQWCRSDSGSESIRASGSIRRVRLDPDFITEEGRKAHMPPRPKSFEAGKSRSLRKTRISDGDGRLMKFLGSDEAHNPLVMSIRRFEDPLNSRNGMSVRALGGVPIDEGEDEGGSIGEPKVKHAIRPPPGRVRMLTRRLSSAIRLKSNSSDAEKGDNGKGTRKSAAMLRPATVNPRSSFFRYWDVVIAALLVYTAVFTPVEVSFFESKLNALFVINRFVDFLFIADMGINFVLPVQTLSGSWILDPGEISRMYFRSWFAIDLISVLPFDLLGVLSDDSETSNLKLRSGRMMKKWESSIAINYAKLQLGKFISTMAFVTHWLACAWHMVITIENSLEPADPNDPFSEPLNWISRYQYLEPDDGAGKKYLTSLYWAVATTWALGYGDVTPTTDGEKAFVIVAAVIGASLAGYMIGAVCSIVSGMDEANSKFFRMMDGLNAFMNDKNLPTDLRLRLRDFFRFRRHNVTLDEWHVLMMQMSPKLRAEVSQHLHDKWIRKLQCFKECSEGTIVDISLAFVTETYCPGEYIIRADDPVDSLYIMERGLAAQSGQIYIISQGTMFGEDMLIKTPALNAVITLSNCVVLALKRTALDRILDQHPREAAIIRRHVVRIILRRGFLEYCRIVERLQWAEELVEDDIMRLPLIHKQRLQIICSTSPAEGLVEVLNAVLTIQHYARIFLQVYRHQRAETRSDNWTAMQGGGGRRGSLKAATPRISGGGVGGNSFGKNVNPKGSNSKNASMESFPGPLSPQSSVSPPGFSPSSSVSFAAGSAVPAPTPPPPPPPPPRDSGGGRRESGGKLGVVGMVRPMKITISALASGRAPPKNKRPAHRPPPATPPAAGIAWLKRPTRLNMSMESISPGPLSRPSLDGETAEGGGEGGGEGLNLRLAAIEGDVLDLRSSMHALLKHFGVSASGKQTHVLKQKMLFHKD